MANAPSRKRKLKNRPTKKRKPQFDVNRIAARLVQAVVRDSRALAKPSK